MALISRARVGGGAERRRSASRPTRWRRRCAAVAAGRHLNLGWGWCGRRGAGFALTLGPTRFGTAWAAAGRRPTSNPVRGERSIMRRRGAGAVGGAGERRAVQPAKGLKDQRNSWFVSLFGAAVQPRGHRRSMALKDQRFRGVVYLYGAYFPRARGRRSRATALRQQTDPLAPPLRRCGCWPPSEFGLGLVRPPWRRLRTDTGADPLWHCLGGGWPTSNFESGSGRTIDHAPPRRWCGRRRGRAPRGSASQGPERSAE